MAQVLLVHLSKTVGSTLDYFLILGPIERRFSHQVH